MKTPLFAVLLLQFLNPLYAQYGGYSPVGSKNHLGNNCNTGVFTNTTYNDGSITSASSATVHFIGSAPNTQHQLLVNIGGATATQIGNAVLQNGKGGLFINIPATGLEILSNFNFNGQNAQVITLRDASSVANNNLHISANASISGSNNANNVNGYIKKDGDASVFTFPLADAAVYAPMTVGVLGSAYSITTAYYNSSPASAGAFEGGPFPLTSVSPAVLTVSPIEYWDINSSGTPLASLSLTFQGDYSAASISSVFILGWRISTNQWEQLPSGAATGLTPGNTINSAGSINFADYSAFTIGFIPPPLVTATSAPEICGQKNGTITATGSKGAPPYQFSLDGINFQSGNIFSGLSSGDYLVTIKDSYGLTNSVNITVDGFPPGRIFAGNDTNIAINQSLQLNVVDLDNAGYNQFTWSPAYGLNDSAIQNPITTLDRNITYTVTAVAPDGCQATAKISIKVFPGPEIYVPTAFTPNGDSKNDILRAIPIRLKSLRYFAVYNRWGGLVFYTNNASKGWDGSIGGKLQNTNTFVWVAEGMDLNGTIILRKGTVVLIR